MARQRIEKKGHSLARVGGIATVRIAGGQVAKSVEGIERCLWVGFRSAAPGGAGQHVDKAGLAFTETDQPFEIVCVVYAGVRWM